MFAAPISQFKSRRAFLAAASCLPLVACSTVTRNGDGDLRSDNRPKSVTPFSAAPANGKMPNGWQPYVLRRDRRPTEYGTVLADNRTVLRAISSNASTSAICPVEISPSKSPWLTWQWKLDRLLPGANVSKDDFDDSPGRVFVAFDGNVNRIPPDDIAFFDMVKFFTGKDLPYATLSYVWDPTIPVDTLVSYSRSTRIKYIVVESGSARLREWVSYRRNVVEDYQRAFGESPGNIITVGIMSDTDDLGQKAEALFGDIAFDSGRKNDIGLGDAKLQVTP